MWHWITQVLLLALEIIVKRGHALAAGAEFFLPIKVVSDCTVFFTCGTVGTITEEGVPLGLTLRRHAKVF